MAERFLTRQAVYVILRNDKGEILLQQRAGTGYLDGYWDFPSGHVEYGESLHEAAARELLEEVHIIAESGSLKLLHIDQYFLDKDYVNYIFEAEKWRGEPKIGEPEKCSAIGWFPLDALPEKCVNVVRVIERAGFNHQLTYSITDRDTYQALMGEDLPSVDAS